MLSVIEVFQQGAWIPAAEVVPFGNGPYQATFEYRAEYIFGVDPQPVSLTLPVTAQRHGVDAETGAPGCPPVLLDLVPQGRGRMFLLQKLSLVDGTDKDLLLVQHGAFNPVGNLRMNTAVAFYERERELNTDDGEAGFALEDIVGRQEAFLEHIWLHAMLTAGTTGVQGAAPKFLLTQNREGLWFADSALPDADAAKHWLVKLPRGKHETDFAVLRNEAAYLRVAAQCGLRVAGEPMFRDDMLFVPRFDRAVTAGGLARLHQESLASLAGLRGFGLPVSLFTLVEHLCPHMTSPAQEVAEFIKRDVLNMALRNTDNHARNTAVHRLPDGTVQLTPLFDFAPMYLDREMIVRGCKWQRANARELTDWDQILDTLEMNPAYKPMVADALKSFAPVVAKLEETMRDAGVDTRVIEDCKPMIATQHTRLEAIRGSQGGGSRG